MELTKLSEFFKPSEIEFRVGATSQDKTKGIALAYITNRAIQNRLDDVCGAENWKNEFIPWREKSQLCGISIKVDGEWVTKFDGADNTTTEAVKGGLSGAMKRAAVQWGIGRYLYDVPNVWVDLVPSGKSYKFKYTPTLPIEFLPTGEANEGYIVDIITDEEQELNEIIPSNDVNIDEVQKKTLTDIIIAYHIPLEKVTKYFKLSKVEDMTQKQYIEYLDILQQNIPNFRMPRSNKKTLPDENEKNELQKLNETLGAIK